MKLNTSQISPGENLLAFSSPKDAWLTALMARVSERGYEFKSPLYVELSLTKLEPDYYMKGILKCSITRECARCAEVFTMPLTQRFEIAFTQSNSRRIRSKLDAADTDELDINFFEGHEIDLSPVIEEQFFLAIPFQSICKADCKGICQKCGINRSHKDCGCVPEIALHPFETLKGFQL